MDLGLLALFHQVFGWPTWLSAGLAFIISFAFTYTIQRWFTFGSQAPHGRALVKYTALVAFNTLATAAIVGLIDLTPAGWAVGKVAATALTTSGTTSHTGTGSSPTAAVEESVRRVPRSTDRRSCAGLSRKRR